MSQIPKSAARRTPLSLSGSGGGGGGGGGGSSSGKHRKTSTESVDKSSNDSRSSTPVTVSLEKINVDASIEKMKSKYTAQPQQQQQQKSSNDAAATGSNEKQQKSISQKTASSTKQGENGAATQHKNGSDKTTKDEKSTNIKNGNNSADKSSNQNGNSHNSANNKTAKDQQSSTNASSVNKNDSANNKTVSEKSTEATASLKQSSQQQQQQQQPPPAQQPQQIHKDSTIRESPRQKDLREAKEKEDAEKQKLLDKKEIDDAIAAVKAEEIKAAKTAQIAAPAPAPIVPVAITAASPLLSSPPKQQQQQQPPPTIAVIPATPDPKSPIKKQRTTGTPKLPPTAANATTNSLALEQDMKGFTSDGEEMESLIMDNEFSDSPMPKSNSKAGSKILKLSQGPPSSASRSRISPYRTAALNKATAIAMANANNASTQINLSTVSEQSTEGGHGGVLSPPLPNSEDHTMGSSLRRISGRKSLRPLREISLHTSYRETYRRLPTDLNDSFSSLNATVGSEIPNDSFRTPYRKRTAAVEDLDADFGEDGQKASPKRARLDLSSFLSLVASPVTMLRNKFARSKLTCSTPNAKKDAAEAKTSSAVSADTVHIDDDAEIDEINKQSEELNVSGIEETNDVVMLDSKERTNGNEGGENQADQDDNNTEEINLNNDDNAADAEVEKTISDLKEKTEQGDDVAANLSDIDTNEQPPRPRSRCRLM